MPLDRTEPRAGRQSRRSFLAKLALGAAAAALASWSLARGGRSAGATAPGTSPEFPGEDSIFHPAQDPRLDPRRNKPK